MNKFYVYAIKDDDPYNRNCIYVDENKINIFALYNFQPSKMEYSGVAVEADTPEEANQVYTSLDGNIIWADEPILTAARTKAYKTHDQTIKELNEKLDKAELAVARLLIREHSKNSALDLMNLNDNISAIAKIVRGTSKDNPDITVEQIYERLKKRYIEQLKNYRYDPPNSSS